MVESEESFRLEEDIAGLFDEVTDTVDEVNPVDVYMDFHKAFDEVPSSTDKKLAMSQTTDYYEALFHRLHTQYQEMPVMGLLLMYSNHYIHLLESSIDMLYSIIRDLANPLPEERLAQSDIKILVLSHNIPDRLYRQWLQRPINMPVTLMMDTSEMEPVEKLVPECLALLLKLGNFILQNPKKTITKPNLSVSDEVRHLIIKENTIKSLCGSSELMTPQKFLEYYEKSMHVVLDSGRVYLGRGCELGDE
ncbi:testis-expressed protein 47-like [Pristis pectinata]|uniref:testis-expressed protein 47-like n=1 Tax=Pristis pectinata TaxID=685728 RepID=UPI00223CEA80|nr:testis-expressed protein 47-like [Pristis pectinata]